MEHILLGEYSLGRSASLQFLLPPSQLLLKLDVVQSFQDSLCLLHQELIITRCRRTSFDAVSQTVRVAGILQFIDFHRVVGLHDLTGKDEIGRGKQSRLYIFHLLIIFSFIRDMIVAGTSITYVFNATIHVCIVLVYWWGCLPHLLWRYRSFKGYGPCHFF